MGGGGGGRHGGEGAEGRERGCLRGRGGGSEKAAERSGRTKRGEGLCWSSSSSEESGGGAGDGWR